MGDMRRWRAARALFVDDRGHGLRLTRHVDQDFVNVSMWRDDRCVETFRLSATEAARLVDFLADGVVAATGRPSPVAPGASFGSP